MNVKQETLAIKSRESIWHRWWCQIGDKNDVDSKLTNEKFVPFCQHAWRIPFSKAMSGTENVKFSFSISRTLGNAKLSKRFRDLTSWSDYDVTPDMFLKIRQIRSILPHKRLALYFWTSLLVHKGRNLGTHTHTCWGISNLFRRSRARTVDHSQEQHIRDMGHVIMRRVTELSQWKMYDSRCRLDVVYVRSLFVRTDEHVLDSPMNLTLKNSFLASTIAWIDDTRIIRRINIHHRLQASWHWPKSCSWPPECRHHVIPRTLLPRSVQLLAYTEHQSHQSPKWTFGNMKNGAHATYPRQLTVKSPDESAHRPHGVIKIPGLQVCYKKTSTTSYMWNFLRASGQDQRVIQQFFI